MYMHTYMHGTHTYIHAHILTHTYAHAHMCTHTQPGSDVQKYFFLALQKQAFMCGLSEQVERTNHKLCS